ncbi:MAG: HAMP domain-containing protein [Deltaproteobacteria bacterium]|jgi:two-component system, NtrC family, sensor kinase|nr:HAMP domain-containing protein [Deltaproteobacteria bacterium]MBT4263641.1 HAMP domain-containing protein [Deltaproteobacteria bacterium]MBT4644027.1 HAMP domain-containing protein [Deltaproteobacteria bacterium]MBT6503674.1 HAMP domain-containing protein [Deltaproteobacteria bacterium]MBT6615739.1 HAMP domain-containing protein [Deltaproteobacteria bacterium]
MAIQEEKTPAFKIDLSEQAQRLLKDRPSFSIMTRLTLGFILWIVLSLGTVIVSIYVTSEIEKKLYFMESSDIYSFEIQQARRFEKNYFLYHTNLNDALSHVRKARQILEKGNKNFLRVLGEEECGRIQDHLSRYESLLSSLENSLTDEQQNEIEIELREHGSDMVTMAKELVAEERNTINSLLVVSKRIPIIFLIILILLITYLAVFMVRQVLWPMKRMMNTTQRISDGDFTPLFPIRKYNDEFSSLAIAMNHMMQQLVHREEALVQSHKLRAIGTLTAGIAHELNNPLNNIVLTASVFKEDYDDLEDEERFDMLTDLVNEADRAQKIIRNLLDYARESEIESVSVDLQGIIRETLRLAGNQIVLSKVKVDFKFTDTLPHVLGDRKQLIQVFLNIILNSLDAMQKGGTLTISIEISKNRDYVFTKFADTGTGIVEEKLSFIFDPFYTTKPEGKGTGLGLSVSQSIIKKHGGDIAVESQVNKGTIITVSLPAAMIPADLSEAHEDD